MNPTVISVVLPALAAADVYDQSLLDPEDGRSSARRNALAGPDRGGFLQSVVDEASDRGRQGGAYDVAELGKVMRDRFELFAVVEADKQLDSLIDLEGSLWAP